MTVTPIASHRRILFASLVGTSVEFYEVPVQTVS